MLKVYIFESNFFFDLQNQCFSYKLYRLMLNFRSLIDLFFLVGIFSFLLSLNHYLSLLLRLEFIIISIYFGVSYFISINFIRREILFIFLSIIICEGVFGLCTLVAISRFSGGDICKIKIF